MIITQTDWLTILSMFQFSVPLQVLFHTANIFQLVCLLSLRFIVAKWVFIQNESYNIYHRFNYCKRPTSWLVLVCSAAVLVSSSSVFIFFYQYYCKFVSHYGFDSYHAVCVFLLSLRTECIVQKKRVMFLILQRW